MLSWEEIQEIENEEKIIKNTPKILSFAQAKMQNREAGRLASVENDYEFFDDYRDFCECWDSKRFRGEKIGVKWDDNFFGNIIAMNAEGSIEKEMKLPFGVFKSMEKIPHEEVYDFLKEEAIKTRSGGIHDGRSYFEFIVKYYDRKLLKKYPKLQAWGQDYTAAMFSNFLYKTAEGMVAESITHEMMIEAFGGYYPAEGEDERAAIDAFIEIDDEVFEISIKSGGSLDEKNVNKFTQNKPNKFFIGLTDTKNMKNIVYRFPKTFNKNKIEKVKAILDEARIFG